MLHPIALAGAHMECRWLKETVPVLTDLLAFERVREGQGQITLKHPNTDWWLTVHEGGASWRPKRMDNHYGVRVVSRREVDAAHEYLTARKEEYGLPQIGKPAYSHGSYSLYFLEPGTNGWEIECYEDALRKDLGGTRVGGVRAPHWERLLPPQRFPAKGYIPQAFTHGTLASLDIAVSRRFYGEVLGLEVIRAREHVVYVKHPKGRPYIVSVARKEPPPPQPSTFRFVLEVESRAALADAHRWFAGSGETLGITGLHAIRADGAGASFLVCDPDRNWWELFAA